MITGRHRINLQSARSERLAATMFERLNYPRINKPAIDHMLAAKKEVKLIEPRLHALVELRVSQINGCAFCVDLHATEARAAGEGQQRLDCIAVWRECQFFNESERAALAWAEALTDISRQGAPEILYEDLKRHFSDEEVVDLTLIVAQMNAWNRLAIGFGRQPRERRN